MSKTSRLLKTMARIPEPVWRAGMWGASLVLAMKPNRALNQWIVNATIVSGKKPSKSQIRKAIRSWGRNLFESLKLGSWSREKILSRVRISTDDLTRLQLCYNTKTVVALPHMGNWDLTGAWACLNGFPVCSVAEQLPPEEFEMFLQVRSALGFKIYSHKTPNLVNELSLAANLGKLVCLVSDRNMGRKGIDTSWPTGSGDQQVRLPAGPVAIAQRISATVLPVYSYYQASKLVIVIGSPITVKPGDEGRKEAADELAKVFAEATAKHLVDWHMFQPFFRGKAVKS